MKKKTIIGLGVGVAALSLGLGLSIGLVNHNKATAVEAAGAVGTSDGYLFVNLSNSGWTGASAKTSVYFFNGDVNAWSPFLTSSDIFTGTTYKVSIPDGTWTSCILVRLNSAAKTPNWNDKWNQTGNITISSSWNTLTPDSPNDDSTSYSRSVTTGFTSGKSIYLDLNGQGWTSDDRKVCAYFWKPVNDYSLNIRIEGHNVHGWDNNNTNLWEFVIPQVNSSNTYFNNVLFYRADSLNGSWNNQTADLTYNSSKNTYKLTSYTGGSWDWNMTDASRQAAYGQYFLDQTKTICADNGANNNEDDLDAIWDNLENEYKSTNTAVKSGLAGISSGSGTDAQAMARYDWIIGRYGTTKLTNFIGRTSGGSGAGIMNSTVTPTATTAMVTTAAVGAAAAVGFFFIRKRKAI